MNFQTTPNSNLQETKTPNDTNPPRQNPIKPSKSDTADHALRRSNRCLPKTAQRALAVVIFATAILSLSAPSARASPEAWRWPLEGQPRILRRFSPPPEPWLAGHRGVDLAAPEAAVVLAPGPGTIRFAGPVAGNGVVTIDHQGGLRTTYLPVAASVRRGQPVTAGAKLGVIEAQKGHCPESCLHWGLLRETRYQDPLLLLGRATIRLLPFWPTTTIAKYHPGSDGVPASPSVPTP
ncbi:M23 family metallopeptidase, partial [Nonomuraea sp. K274]